MIICKFYLIICIKNIRIILLLSRVQLLMLILYVIVFCLVMIFLFYVFFFNDTATTEIYTLSLHDALPICERPCPRSNATHGQCAWRWSAGDRKSTRLNSSHMSISYAVFCLKKKKKNK